MRLAPEAASDWCLQQGGEMGARMRALDWSRTSLGPVADWPRSLKVSVALCLRSRFPIAIFWGREHYAMLYNDAYIPLLGAAKHPGWLGMSGRECWREVWPTVGPMMESVFETGEPVWFEDLMLILERQVPREECYFTFSYSAIPSRETPVAGIFCVCAESTERVIGERRLRALRELGGRALLARSEGDAADAVAQTLGASRADLPFALLYLLDYERRMARLAAVSGLERGEPAAPAAIDVQVSGRPDPWQLREVMLSGQPLVLEGLEERVGGALRRAPGADAPGNWPEPARDALVLPLTGSGRTLGFLVAGLSPRRVLDEPYRAFCNLVAGHIATGLVTARAFDEERRRARVLAELDSAKTAFFGNVSHEFRTPLTLMLGPLEDALADRQTPLPPEQRERIDAALRNSLRLLKLVNTLLDFSRIEAGRVRACFEPVDLCALTQELASSFRSACERAGLLLDVRCSPLPQPVYVDRDMWEKIVLNLMSNAFKFTLEGSIEVRLAPRERGAELCISDTGLGIAPEEMPHIFERFHRVVGARARTMEGTGIGLALVQELVRLHGGSIRVESVLGAGSSFIVRLPFGPGQLPADQIGGERVIAPTAIGARPFVEEALRWLPERAAGDTPQEPPLPVPAGPITPARGLSARREEGFRARPLVLCADDNTDLRCYVSRLLAPLYDVIAVGDGEQALETALIYRPDLIVADVMMPQMDGVALLKALRARAITAVIPVLLLSARAGEEAKIEGLDAGADDYLEKPFSARELLARVRSQLALSFARRAHEREREDFHTLFMQAPNVFLILRGPEYIVELANPPACRALHRSYDEILERPLFEAVPELDGLSCRATLDGVLRTGAPYQGREVASTVHWRGEGESKVEYYNYVFSPLRSIEGRIEGVLIDAFTVTEEVIARQEMGRLRAEAESANRMKDEFLAMLGHELRNPLAPMVMALQIMRLRGGVSREQEILERQVSHLTRLMDDLLDVSRITRGKIELRRRPLEIGEAVACAVETVTPLLTQRRHKIEIDSPAEGLMVFGDPERLAQVLLNLLTNAAKYSEAGSTIRIQARRRGGRIELGVCDEGMGIAPEMLEKVFDVFVQQPRTLDRSAGGLGLGLAIVRSLIEMHEGTVSARSAGPGKGSEFIIELPALDPRHPAPREPVRSWSSLVPSRDTPPR